MNNNSSITDVLRNFFINVFMWMGMGLLITAATSWYIAYYNPAILGYILQSSFVLIFLCLLQLVLVVVLSARIMSMPFNAALILFLVYAFLNGIIFSTLFVEYSAQSIMLTAVIAAGMFFAMAFFGSVTRINLTPIGTFCYMTLWGIIIALFINMYFKSDTLNIMISGLGVIIFSALTAYDMQRLTGVCLQLHEQARERYQVALLGSLMLYLDFINLFLMLLSFTGKRRD